MKTIYPANALVAFLILITLSVKGQSSKGDSTIVVRTKIYCDHCLDCNDCGGKLVHDLSFVKGIKKNALDTKAMTITITYQHLKTNPGMIRDAISKMGYDADDINADPLAYQKLDGCCKKTE